MPEISVRRRVQAGLMTEVQESGWMNLEELVDEMGDADSEVAVAGSVWDPEEDLPEAGETE